MGRLQAKAIHLSERQKQLLQQERNRRQVSVQMRERIDIILKSAEGMTNQGIHRQTGSGRQRIIQWRNRWACCQEDLSGFEAGVGGDGVSDKELLEKMMEILTDAPRSGKPPVFTAAQREQITALACEKPSKLNLPYEEWTGELLAQTCIARGIVSSISGRHVNKLLKKSHPPP